MSAMKNQHKKKLAPIEDAAQRDIAQRIDELAVITSKGFDRVEERFEAIDRRFEAIDKRFVEIERRLDKIWLEVGTMRRDMYDIKKEMIQREEFEQLIARVEFLEKKLRVRV